LQTTFDDKEVVLAYTLVGIGGSEKHVSNTEDHGLTPDVEHCQPPVSTPPPIAYREKNRSSIVDDEDLPETRKVVRYGDNDSTQSKMSRQVVNNFEQKLQ